MSHIWLGIFVVGNFSYLEKKRVGGGGVGEWGEVESSICSRTCMSFRREEGERLRFRIN